MDCLERLSPKSAMPAGDFKSENSPIAAFATIRFEESEIGLCGDYADSGSHDELTICFSCESPDSDIAARRKEPGERGLVTDNGHGVNIHPVPISLGG